MDFAFDEEQEELRRSVRRFLEQRSPETEVRRLMATAEGYDPAVWQQMATELGLQGIAVPEQYGGAGAGPLELTVVFEEMGRALLCAPFFSTVALAANLLVSSADPTAMAELLPGIAAGTTVAAVALLEASGRWDEGGVALAAARGGPGWTLTGEKRYVLDGHVADLLLVPARTPSGVSIFAVDGHAPGVGATTLPTLDQTRKQADVAFHEAPARLVGQEGAGWAAVERTLDLAAVALAAEQVGGAQRALDMAVEHARTRIQFGRPIGSFQAVKHRCADLLVEVEAARSAAYYAAWAASASEEELPAVASLAKSCCSEAYFHAAAGNIQVHGGIGFTWEHPAHLYFKRAKSSELLLGDPAYHRELLARRLGI